MHTSLSCRSDFHSAYVKQIWEIEMKKTLNIRVRCTTCPLVIHEFLFILCSWLSVVLNFLFKILKLFIIYYCYCYFFANCSDNKSSKTDGTPGNVYFPAFGSRDRVFRSYTTLLFIIIVILFILFFLQLQCIRRIVRQVIRNKLSEWLVLSINYLK